jgi:hypothetical protein
VITLLGCCAIAALDKENVDRALRTRAGGVIVLFAVALDEVADRWVSWRTGRKARRLIARYEMSPRKPW